MILYQDTILRILSLIRNVARKIRNYKVVQTQDVTYFWGENARASSDILNHSRHWIPPECNQLKYNKTNKINLKQLVRSKLTPKTNQKTMPAIFTSALSQTNIKCHASLTKPCPNKRETVKSQSLLMKKQKIFIYFLFH